MKKDELELPPATTEPMTTVPRKASISTSEKLLWMGLVWVFLLLGIIILYVQSQAKGTPTNEQPDLFATPQIARNDQPKNIQVKDWGYVWQLYEQGNYVANGRIAAKKISWFNIYSRLSPVKVLMAWGDISDPEAMATVNLRFYEDGYLFGGQSEIPYQQDYICSHSALIFFIPATRNLRAAIRGLESGSVVHLEGRLMAAQTELFENELGFAMESGAKVPYGSKTLYLERLVVDGYEYR